MVGSVILSVVFCKIILNIALIKELICISASFSKPDVFAGTVMEKNNFLHAVMDFATGQKYKCKRIKQSDQTGNLI
jgi:hypothetical protein